MSLRRPAVAGIFYPSDPDALRQAVRQFLQDAAPTDAPSLKAIIAPHAGYVYSGPIAGSAYAAIPRPHDWIGRVILLGPAHFYALRGLAVSETDRFATPLGMVKVDSELRSRALEFPRVETNEEAFEGEHSLEVHLPFLQEMLKDFTVLAVLVGRASAHEVADMLEAVGGKDDTLIVVSSDMSHYHPYEEARRIDAATARAVEALDYEKIDYQHACGRDAVNGLLEFGRRRGLKARTLDLRNSGDTAGPRRQVVGYGAFAIA